jgi:hypothetical protein
VTDLSTVLDPLRTAGLRDVILPGLIDNDGPAPMFRPSGTDVYLEMGDNRMLRLAQVADGIRLSLVTDYAVPAGLGEDEEFGVSSLQFLVMVWHDDEPPLTRVRYAPDAGSDPTVVHWIEFEFGGGLRLTAGPVSRRGIALAVGPGYDEWDDDTELPVLSDLIGAPLRDVVVPGYIERDQKVPELVTFSEFVYLVMDRGFVEAEQVRGGGGVQFRPVTAVTAPVKLTDAEEEVGYVSLAALLPDDSVVTGARYGSGPDDDPGQGIVRAAEFELGGAVRLVLDPMTLLSLELSVRRPEPAGESVTIAVPPG